MEFDDKVQNVVKAAVARCIAAGNEYVTPEHLLYGLFMQDEFVKAFESLGGNVDTALADLDSFFDEVLPKKELVPGEDPIDVSAGFSSVMDIASASAKHSGNSRVSLHHMLWGIYEQQESFAVFYIERQLNDKEELLYRLEENVEGEEDGDENSVQGFAECLNDKLDAGNPLIGREEELERALWILCRKEKNNVLFVGESGVGKTAMARGITQRIVSGDVSPQLKKAKVYSLDIASLIAGTQYRGELERRIRAIMECFGNEEFPIVFIDDIHNLVCSGESGNASRDMAYILNPYLESGKIRFVGTTYYNEYKKNFSKNSSLGRRFQKIDIKEPSRDEAVKILGGLKKKYESFHHVRYSKGMMEYMVDLSIRYINEKFLPDKALDLMDEAGAYRKLHPNEDKKMQYVDRSTVEEVLSKTVGVPVQMARSSEADKLGRLYDQITENVFGQDEAVRKIVDAICMSRAGLLEDNKPIASLLFVGPTGVGKTEVAKVLARELGVQLVRFDMSEYAEKHTVAKLIGSPAGYVGYEDGGLLTDAIRKAPHSVLLLDEIEKAHADIYNILLQVMDYATLTDSQGNKVDFRNVIIIMTSNAGARSIGKQKIGFGEIEYDDSIMLEEVKRIFAPEFRNRLSSIVTFNNISEQMADLIVDKKLSELRLKLDNKKVSLFVSKAAHEYLASKGITREYGAREIERTINNLVKPLLVQEILFGRLKNGGKAKIDAKNKKIVLECNKRSAKRED